MGGDLGGWGAGKWRWWQHVGGAGQGERERHSVWLPEVTAIWCAEEKSEDEGWHAEYGEGVAQAKGSRDATVGIENW